MHWNKIVVFSSLAGTVALWPGRAGAVSIAASDCNFGFQETYDPGDAVCVTGELDVVPPGAICGEAYVIVTPAGSVNPFFDVTGAEGMGAANYIIGCGGAGAFYDEYVWLPPLKPGQYDLVIDQWPFFGSFSTEDYRLENAFTVTNAPLVFTVDVAAIKGAAEDGLLYAQSLHDLVTLLTILDTLSTAADWAGAFGTNGALAAVGLGVVCYATETPCPTSYNSAVINIGNLIIGHMADALTLHYGAIIADPPDPMFEDVVALRLDDAMATGGPWAPPASAALPMHQTRIAQLLSVQAAAYQALLPTIEKLQGAQQAGSHFGLLIQAEQTQAYAGLAMQAGDDMLAELDAMQAALEAEGTYDTAIDAGSMLESIAGGALTDEDRALIRSFGYSAADIDAAVAAAGELPVPGAVSWQAVVDEARNQYQAMRPALEDLIAQAENIRTENEPYALRSAPVASVTASGSGTVGETLVLSSTATHIDPDATLTYDWDLDGDGEFDDGNGQDVELTPVAPGLVVVAVQVHDGARRDLAMATIAVEAGNLPPELTSLQPSDYAPFADVGEVIELSAEATDPDGDPVTLTWFVDGSEAGTGSVLSFEMPDEEHHGIEVVASDDDPYSADAAFTFHVRASVWQSPGGDTDGGTAGSDGDTAATNTASASGTAGSTTDSAASAGTDDGTATAAETDDDDSSSQAGDEGGCNCTADSGRRHWTPALLGLAVLGLLRRRRRV